MEPLFCNGKISNSLAPLLCPDMAVLHQSPTPHTITISAEWALKACQARYPQLSRSLPSSLHRTSGSWLCWDTLPRSAKLGIHRHAGSPLHQLHPSGMPDSCSKGPPTSPQLKASTQRPMGTHSPVAHQRRPPNLPERHTDRYKC
jgi:hypothetical protein